VSLECTGTRTLRGVLGPGVVPRVPRAERARWAPFDTLRRRRTVLCVRVRQVRERSPGEISGDAFTGKPWKGRIPWEHPAGGVLTARPAARDSREGQSPGAAARRSDLKLRPKE
jgi:hypothetical protein